MVGNFENLPTRAPFKEKDSRGFELSLVSSRPLIESVGPRNPSPSVRLPSVADWPPEVLKMPDVVSPARVAAGLNELWSPRVVAELDDSYALHTGSAVTAKTGSLAEQLRPV